MGDEGVVFALPKNAPMSLVAPALVLAGWRWRQQLPTIVAGQGLEVIPALPYWQNVTDGFSPLDVSNVVLWGADTWAETGFFEQTIEFADWPKQFVAVGREYNMKQSEVASKIAYQLLENETFTPAFATDLILMMNFGSTSVRNWLENLPTFQRLLASGANFSKIAYWTNFKAPSRLWWKALTDARDIAQGWLAVFAKDQFKQFGFSRVDLFELAQAVHQSKSRWQVKMQENAEEVRLELINSQGRS